MEGRTAMAFAFFGLVVAPALAQPAIPPERDRVQPPKAPESAQERAHPLESAGGVQNPQPADRSKPNDERAKFR
jgi:hypothetical protein